MDPERFDESKLIVLWGATPIVSNLHLWSRVQEAKRRGAKVIASIPTAACLRRSAASTSPCSRYRRRAGRSA